MLILNHLWIIWRCPCGRGDQRAARQELVQVARQLHRRRLGFAFVSRVLELIREFAQLPADQIPWVDYFTWITAGPFRVDFALQVDQLTIVMLLVVTFVSSLVHIYSTGYMAHEGGYYRFFSI